jgi:hypothetical protein
MLMTVLLLHAPGDAGQRGANKKRGGRGGAACVVTVQKSSRAGGKAQVPTGLGTLQVIRPARPGQAAARQPGERMCLLKCASLCFLPSPRPRNMKMSGAEFRCAAK